jgi:hypothetical protein
MSNADNTQDRPLTTEQIATAGSRPPQEEDDVTAPAGRQGYQDDSAAPADADYVHVNDYDNAAPVDADYADATTAPRGTDYTDRGAAPADGHYDDVSAAPVDAGYDDSAAAPLDTDYVAPADVSRRAPETVNASSGAGSGTRASLLGDDELQNITMRWKDIQAEFVDEPKTAVQEADALVAELMQRLAAMFADERADLENRWAGGNEVTTEDLRQGLRRYRSFFERLLAA